MADDNIVKSMRATIETDSDGPVLVLVLPLAVIRRAAPTTIETTGEEAPQSSRPGVAKVGGNVVPFRKAIGQ